MRQGFGTILMSLLTVCTPWGSSAADRVRPVSGFHSGSEDPLRAPDQYRQPLYLPPHRSLYTSSRVEDVFEGEVFEEPDFLPPQAYEDDPPIPLGHSIRMAQYPLTDSAARDSDPEGRYANPRWNPVPGPGPGPGPDCDQTSIFPPWQGMAAKERAFTVTHLPRSGDGLGMTTLDFRSTLYPANFPLVQVTPRFSWHFLAGPAASDLPPRLYDVDLDFQVYLPAGERWAFLGGFAPSLFTDFNNLANAFRMTGRGLVFYKWSERVKLVGGFLYLDRDDVTALPAGGVIYSHSPDAKFEIMFPRPKLAYRFRHDGAIERWVYLAGELGGGSWAIERAAGFNDTATLRDFRLMIGVEHVQGDSFRWLTEVGYVFGRQLEYGTGVGDMPLSDTGMLRFGLVY